MADERVPHARRHARFTAARIGRRTTAWACPAFRAVLASVLDAWQNRRTQLDQQARPHHASTCRQSETAAGSGRKLSEQILMTADAKLERAFDFTHGGFGSAPKFPHSMDLQLLLRIWKRTGRDRLLEMVRLNLDKMAAGGIYDHLAGGFARYSVDERWLVPHFEKMLYDNALLTSAYIEALSRHRRRALRPHRARDDRLHPRLHDRRRRRLPQHRRRR